jgi:hypothetical protein
MTDRSKYLDRACGRIYFRTNGTRQRLPDDESSPEFAAAYDALIAGRMLAKPKRALCGPRRTRLALSAGSSSNIWHRNILLVATAAGQNSRPERN